MKRPGVQWRTYALAVLVFAVGYGLNSVDAVRRAPGVQTALIFFTVLVPAWRGGFGPALLSSVLIGFVTLYPNFEPQDLARVALMIPIGASVGVLAERQIRARRHEAESRRALSAVLDSIGEGVIATDEEGLVTFANPVACTLTGWDAPALLGRPIREVARLVDAPGGTPIPCPISQVLGSGEPVGSAGSPWLVGLQGREKPVQAGARPIRDGERLRGAVLVIRDDTLRREAERRLRDDARRKDDFIAMLAHELRNPLGTIRLAVEMLCTDHPGADHDWAMTVLQRQVGQLGRILDDLLDVARIARGRVALRKERLDADAALARASESVRPRFNERGHRLDVQYGDGAKPILADPVRLEQVLVNLLVNACKYTPPGGHIRIRSSREGDLAVIRVEDDGMGIRPEMLPTVFEPFAQADRSLDRSEGGLGIGLSVVRGLVRHHGGDVTAESPGPGLGSTFTVRLPLAPDAPKTTDDVAPTAAASAPSPGDPPSHRGKVLIIDDNVDLAASLARLLARAGYDTATAHDGPEGLDAAGRFDPDAILLDIGLPGLSGYDVARNLRATERFRNTRLIAISGYGSERDRIASKDAGFNHHLLKPIELPDVLELLDPPA